MNKKYLEKKYLQEVEFLNDGIKNSKNPYHFFTLSTNSNNNPESRTVVLRGLELNPFTIYFNTDLRSNKIVEINENPIVSILFYDNLRKTQLRLKANAIVHSKNEIVRLKWENTALQSRKCYMAPFKPSSKLEKWHPNLPLEFLDKDPDKKNSELGYNNFCVIELVCQNLEILELHHSGHIRFRKNFNTGKSYFIAT